jgi:hypothetical protein
MKAIWIVVGAVLVLCAGCSGGGGTTANNVVDVRHVEALLFHAGANPEQFFADDPAPPPGIQVAPFDVYTSFNWDTGPQDLGRSHLDSLGKAEVDYGDGGGWEDITQSTRDLYTVLEAGGYGAGIPLSADAHHTYTDRGLYDVHWRFTYWDGQEIDLPQTVGIRVTGN